MAAFSVLLGQHTDQKDGVVSRWVEVEAYAFKISMDIGVVGEVKVTSVNA